MKERTTEIFDFPEDGFPVNEESRIQDRLIEKIMIFARRFYDAEMEKSMALFAPPGPADPKMLADGVGNSLMLDFFDWFLFDCMVDPEMALTVTDIFLRRKKLDLSGREKNIIAMMSQARMDLFEIREVCPGRGVVLRRLADGSEFPIVEMKASRQLKRWALIVCRLWSVDGVWRLSPAMYAFEPGRRPFLEKIINEFRNMTKKTGSSPDDFRCGFSPLICREWLELALHPRKPEMRNRDGHRLVFCRALFRTDNRAAVHFNLLGQKKILTEENGPDQIIWLSPERDEAGGRKILGSFFWDGNDLAFEANSLRRFNRGLAILKQAGGAELRLIEETRKPIEKMLAEAPAAAVGEMPAGAEIIAPEKMLEFKRAYYKGWLKKPIPALQGKTPLQAVRSSAGKKRVAELLKGIEHMEEESRLRGEPALDSAFLWEGLGLASEDF
ncbi:MAG: MbcA/ParS/Xre antitoxin family protein [Candidatus Aminicenantes bacterium]|nr:MbcA/ParS/Xre antitoxin family protein [Candidatus Aminicenantes bacterium]